MTASSHHFLRPFSSVLRNSQPPSQPNHALSSCPTSVSSQKPSPSSPRHWKEKRINSVSLFISNIPQVFSKIEIFALFSKVGKIVDIFIPFAKDSRNHRGFAFVRFKSEVEALRGIVEVNGRMFKGKKLEVTPARKPKDSAAPPPSLDSSESTLAPGGSGLPSAALSVAFSIWTVVTDKGKSIILSLWAVQKKIESLKGCLVASFAAMSVTDDNILDWFSDWGVLGSVSVQWMVHHHALLSFSVCEEVDRMLFEFPNLLDTPFSDLCFWTEEWDRQSCWVRVTGIPLRAWFPESIRAIGDFLDKVVEIDPRTISGSNLRFARFRIVLAANIVEIKKIPIKVGDFWIDVGVELEDNRSSSSPAAAKRGCEWSNQVASLLRHRPR